MKKKIMLLVSLMLAFTMLLAAGCGGGNDQSPDDKPLEFTIGHCTWVGYGPLYIAQEKGIFAKHNLAPKLVIIEDESQYAPALAAGQIDGLGNVLDREVIHFAKGTPETIILAMAESLGGDGIVATADIQTVQDLKGATVGLDKSSTAYFFFLTVLEQYGMTEDDVTIYEMSAGDAGAAFVAGRLDAAVVWEPWLTNASQRDGGHVLVSSAEFPRTIVDIITLREEFVKENPEAVVALTMAWFEAIEFYRANPDEGNEIMAKAMGLSKEDIEEMAAGVAFFGREENLDFFNRSSKDNIFEVAQRAIKFWQDEGIITTEVDIDSLITDIYVLEASK